MQLASLLDPAHLAPAGRRDLRTKWRQMRAARALEQRWTKDEILEAYLNLLGLRGELRGIGATSAALLHKQPSGLTADESVLLATLISAPNATAERVAARACALVGTHALAADCAHLRALASAMLAGGRRRRAHAGPRAAARATPAAHCAGQRVTTTLSAGLQALAVDVLARHLRSLDGRNVRDAAAVVLDNASGDVLAYVGSAGPNSSAAAPSTARRRCARPARR